MGCLQALPKAKWWFPNWKLDNLARWPAKEEVSRDIILRAKFLGVSASAQRPALVPLWFVGLYLFTEAKYKYAKQMKKWTLGVQKRWTRLNNLQFCYPIRKAYHQQHRFGDHTYYLIWASWSSSWSTPSDIAGIWMLGRNVASWDPWSHSDSVGLDGTWQPEFVHVA